MFGGDGERGLHAQAQYHWAGKLYSSLEAVMAAMGGQTVAESDSDDETLKRIVDILNDNDKREQFVQEIFTQQAGSDGRLQVNEMLGLAQMLCLKIGLPRGSLDNAELMFYRFDFDGDGALDETEAAKLIKFVLRREKKERSPPQHIQLDLEHRDLHAEFELGKKLGQGGQGAVYLAKNIATGQSRVVKFYEKAAGTAPIDDIKDEFKLLKSLDHPNIAKIVEAFEDYENVYVVSEPYGGGDLTTLIPKAHQHGVAVTHEWIGKVFLQALEGLAYLHSKEHMHCDLKEPNIMIADDRNWDAPLCLLIDFGMAKDFGGERLGGTPGYMPPEFWQYNLWTPKGDMFALAVTFVCIYHGGQHPFHVPDAPPFQRIAQATCTLPLDCSGLPPGLQVEVMKMADKDFRRRPTAKDVVASPYFQNLGGAGGKIDQKAINALIEAAKKTDLQNMIALEIGQEHNVAQMKQFNDLFMFLDKEGDGNVVKEEAEEGLRKFGFKESLIHKLVDSLLGDNGKIRYTEFMAKLIASTTTLEASQLASFFKKVDTDNSGTLSRDELAALLEQKNMSSLLKGRSAEDLLQEMDENHDGVVSFGEFKRAIIGNSRAKSKFEDGAEVEYYSSSHHKWVECKVTRVNSANGAIQIDVKPGSWFDLKMQTTHLRAKAGASKFKEGEVAEYFSSSAQKWIECSVTKVDPGNGAVEIDVKPGAVFDLAMQTRQLRSKTTASKFKEGAELEYYSASHHKWVECKVTHENPGNGAIQIDVKPGAWFNLVSQQRQLRPRGGSMDAGYPG